MADQYLDPAMLQYLFEQGTGSSPAMMLARPENTDDWGTLDEQGARLTQLSKVSNLAANPNFVVGLGQQGYAPEAFEPVTTYTPVNTKGRDQLQRWLQGSDPINRFIAESLLSPQPLSPDQINSTIQAVLTDPNNENYEAFMNAVPNAIVNDPATGMPSRAEGVPDWNAVTRRAVDAEQLMLSDDPWDGQTVDEQGRPAMAQQTDSEPMAALKAMGFTVTPYDEFTQQQLAPEGQLEMQQQRLDPLIRENVSNIEGLAAAQRQSREMLPQYEDALRASMARTAFQNAGGLAPPAGMGTPERVIVNRDSRRYDVNTREPASSQEPSAIDRAMERTPQRGGWADDLARFVDEPGAYVSQTFDMVPEDYYYPPTSAQTSPTAGRSMLSSPAPSQSPLMDAMLGMGNSNGGARQPTLEERERQRLRAAIMRQKGNVLTGQQKMGRSTLALNQQSDKDWLGEQQRLGAIEQLRASGITPFTMQQQAMNRMLLG